jgi:hypothetical protein
MRLTVSSRIPCCLQIADCLFSVLSCSVKIIGLLRNLEYQHADLRLLL